MYLVQIKDKDGTKWRPESITKEVLVNKEYAQKELQSFLYHDRRLVRVSGYPVDGQYQILEVVDFRKAAEEVPF